MRSIIETLRRPVVVLSGLAVAGGVLVAVAPSAQAATFTVTNTDDSGAGSLRQAIEDANSTAGADTIDFAIGTGPQSIQLTSAVNATQALPIITEAVMIDGTTQPGYAGIPLIEVLEQAPPSARTAFTISTSDVSISGLSLVGFGTGVRFTATSSTSEVRDSYFGINLAGNAVQGQQMNAGVEVAGGNDNAVLDNQIANAGTGIWVYGSAAPGSPRVISGNRIGIGISNTNPLPVDQGILLDTSTSSVNVSGNAVVGHPGNSFGIRLVQTGGLISVTGNRIGFGADDFPSFPGRVGGGIVLNGATSSPAISNNQIFGGSGTGLVVNAFSNIMAGGASGNVISGNGGAGISVSGGTLARFQIGGNQIFDNVGLGIDVAPAGVNSVPDGGPTIDSITPGTTGTNSITMTYAGPSSSAGAVMNIHLTTNDECDPSGFGEGSGQLGSSFISRTLDANGDFFETFPVDATINPGDLVTAMLSSGDVPSTEYSNCFTVPGGPTNTAPVASDTSAVAQENDSVVVQLEGFDADGDALTFGADATSVAGGSVSEVFNTVCEVEGLACTAEVTYTAPADFVGSDTFTFTVDDLQEESAPATVTVDVQGAENLPPQAYPTSAETTENTSVVIDLTGYDAEGDVLDFFVDGDSSEGGSIGAVENLSCGLEGLCTAQVVYTPLPGFTGADSFAFFTVDGAESASDPATVLVDVLAANSPPEALDQTVEGVQGGPVVFELQGFDVDSDQLTFDVPAESTQGGVINVPGVVLCSDGLCSVEASYTPPVEFSGDDTFTFTVNDGLEDSAPATVSLSVNTAPVAQPGEFSVVSDGTASGRVLYATDIDEDILTFAITEQPLHGEVLGPNDVTCGPNATFGGDWTCQQTWGYQADPGYSGPDSFVFEACDLSVPCDTATVAVTVTAPPGPDLELSLIDTPDPVNAGGVVAYQATLENTGAGSASGVEVTFTGPPSETDLPLGTTWVGSTVTSDLGGSGSCVPSGVGTAVVCTPGIGELPAGPDVWTITIFLETGPTTPSPFSVNAEATTLSGDTNSDNNADTQLTMIEPATNDEATEYVPPSAVTETVATAETVLVGGAEIPIAQPGDTTAAAASVPPGGPGGVVTVAELDCEPPFVCAAAARTTVPTPGTPPIDEKVVQFIPPFAPFYNYLHPVTYTIAYDAFVVAGVNTRRVTALYTKEDDPGTAANESQVLYQAAKCPKTLTASTEFPCLKSAKVLKGKNLLLKGDLVLTLLGTYNDPKIAGFR